jgi:hypothetical protein
MADKNYGQVIRDLHARPEKVYVSDDLKRLDADAEFKKGLGRSYKIQLNAGNIKDLDPSYVNQVLAHESGHGLANVTGVGGPRQPTGIGLVDMFAGHGDRMPRNLNEGVADALAGTMIYGVPSPEAKAKADLVRQIMKRKVK